VLFEEDDEQEGPKFSSKKIFRKMFSIIVNYNQPATSCSTSLTGSEFKGVTLTISTSLNCEFSSKAR
jgi:hypothetical protein